MLKKHWIASTLILLILNAGAGWATSGSSLQSAPACMDIYVREAVLPSALCGFNDLGAPRLAKFMIAQNTCTREEKHVFIACMGGDF